MECCDNINIGCKNYENICINCGTIHDYKYVNEISFRDYNMNMLNMLFYKKKLFIKRKNIYMIYVFILKKLMKTQYYFSIIHWKILGNCII